jgi:hypothetical protein
MGQTAARAFISLLSTFPGINDSPSADSGLNSIRMCSLVSQISFALYPDLKNQLQLHRSTAIESGGNGRMSVRPAVIWQSHEGWRIKNSVDALMAQKAVHFTQHLFHWSDYFRGGSELSLWTSRLRAGRSERTEFTLTLFAFLAVLVRFLLTYLRFSQGSRSKPINSAETE